MPPYIAVLTGVYALHSAWVAVCLSPGGCHRSSAASGNGLACGCSLPVMRTGCVLLSALAGIGAGVLLFACWPLLGISHAFSAQLTRLAG